MQAHLHRLPPIAVPLLLAVALLGYLAGARHLGTTTSAQLPAADLRVASGADVLLEYPPGWQPQSRGPAIAGLRLSHPLFLSTAGGSAGLEAGMMPGPTPGPLPSSLLSRLRGLPHVEVVSLAALQAFRYSDLGGAGAAQQLELYAVPSSAGGEAVLACHAPRPAAVLMAQCRRIVATLALAGQASAGITPDPAYASRLGLLVSALDGARRAARGRMAATRRPAELARLSGALAGRFLLAARALARLEPPPVAGATQVALARSMIAAGDAYAQLAKAARGQRLGDYFGARSGVAAAEQALDGALESYALLGYGRG